MILLAHRDIRSLERKLRRKPASKRAAAAFDICPACAITAPLPLIRQLAASRFHGKPDQVVLFPDNVFRLFYNLDCACGCGFSGVRGIAFRLLAVFLRRVFLRRFLWGTLCRGFFGNRGSFFLSYNRSGQRSNGFFRVADHAAILLAHRNISGRERKR